MRKIVLTVSSAKVVNTNNKGNCRKTIVRNGSLEECLNDMDNIIHVNHIVNALHVMFGARPVSFKYGNRNKLSQKITNIVENGIIRYDNVYKGEVTSKNGDKKTIFCNEFTQGKKAVYNSNRNNLLTTAFNDEKMYANFTWSSLYKSSLLKNSYKKVLDIINDYAKFINCDNITKEYTLIDVLAKIKHENPDWIERFKDKTIEISPIMNFLIDSDKKPGDSFNSIKSPNLAGLGNMNAVTPKVSVNATIILFMNDEDAENLLRGKRYATILDNGFIYIANNEDNNIINNIREFTVVDSVDDYIEDYLDEGFVKINKLPYTNGKTAN